jgi:biotin carboxyl carrier protein
MKMKNEIKAPAHGVVARVLVNPGDQVQHGTPLIEFEV